MLLALVSIAALAVLAAYFVLNQKNETQERTGLVKEILNKDALFVDFDDRRSNVVKLHGLKMACEKEMLNDQIFEFLYRELKGKRIRVKPVRVDTGEILISEIYSLGGEYLNELLIRQGYARWNPSEAANDRRLSQAQELAQAKEMGVWNPTVKQLMAEGTHEPEDLEDPEEASEEGSVEEPQAEECELEDQNKSVQEGSESDEPVAAAEVENAGTEIRHGN